MQNCKAPYLRHIDGRMNQKRLKFLIGIWLIWIFEELSNAAYRQAKRERASLTASLLRQCTTGGRRFINYASIKRQTTSQSASNN